MKGVESIMIVETIDDERPLTAASARTVRDRDLKLRPILRPSDLVRVAPGLMVVQHAGGGKANQYLLRGFDADHGTDVALSFDGIPVNMVSHGHGQGYADTNFVIPELIERVQVSKGPYFVENGDFSSAGSVDFITRSRGESFVSAQGGSFDTGRAVTIVSPEARGAVHPLFAAEAIRTNGPFDNPERFEKLNLFGKVGYDLGGNSSIALGASAYSGSWNASGQVPTRAVESGLIGRFGSLDPTEGGASSRSNLYLQAKLRPDDKSAVDALAYVSRYDFSLNSNFTFFSADPVNGDQIEQRDGRTIAGSRVTWRRLDRLGGVVFDSSIGGVARTDAIANGLAHTKARERLETVVDADVNESSVGAFAKEAVQPWRWLRVVGAVRVDHFTFRVDDRLEDMASEATATSGARGAGLVSPKGSIVVSPHRSTDLFLNFGMGFHSNDARGVVRNVDAVTPLARTIGYEVGARTRLLDRRLEVAAALWGLDVSSEIVWVGDEGVTEASSATRRIGAEMEARAEVARFVFLDADVTITDAKFRENAGNANSIALAPRLTGAGGVGVVHRTIRGGVRALYIGERPATEDEFLTAEAYFAIDAYATWRWREWELSAWVENALNRANKSAQFATVTRLAGEAPTDAPPPGDACPGGTRAATDEATGNFRGCEDVSFTPANPISVRAGLTYYF